MKESENKSAVLVAVETGKLQEELTIEHLEELAFLAETAGITTVEKFTQRLPHPDVRTFVGKGKFAEIMEYVFEHDVNYV
ncbi:MAG TPA: GTPase HflX, partial [Cyclobacteriaceae bacterium]|nr:GTPase HflX [Cyclobacteriaceae bacterium]